jgi:hypothetical protein
MVTQPTARSSSTTTDFYTVGRARGSLILIKFDVSDWRIKKRNKGESDASSHSGGGGHMASAAVLIASQHAADVIVTQFGARGIRAGSRATVARSSCCHDDASTAQAA